MDVEVTDEDREKAVLVVARLPISLGDYRTRDLDAARDVIAQALAAERAKARAPFLALARQWESNASRAQDVGVGAVAIVAANEIRRAAEDPA